MFIRAFFPAYKSGNEEMVYSSFPLLLYSLNKCGFLNYYACAQKKSNNLFYFCFFNREVFSWISSFISGLIESTINQLFVTVVSHRNGGVQ